VNANARPARLMLIAMLVIGGLAATTEAHAAWETLRLPRADDRNCGPINSNEGHYDRRYILARRDNRSLLIKPGSDVELEVYGHLLDLVTSVGTSGIIGASAQRTGGHSGVVNAARHCGAIGSIKVRLRVPADAPDQRAGTLNIGGERIPLQVVHDRYRVSWSVFNDSAALSPQTQAQIEADRQAALEQSIATREANRAQCAADIQACEQTRAQARAAFEAAMAAAAAQCQAGGNSCGGGSLIIVGRPPCATLVQSCRGPEVPRPNAANESTARCLRDLGGNVAVDSNGTLNVVIPPLPRRADGELDRCLQRGFIIEAETVITRADIGTGTGRPIGSTAPSPVRRQTRSTGAHPLLFETTPLPNRLTNFELLKATLPGGARQNLLGADGGELAIERSRPGTTTAFYAGAPLRWVVLTAPPNGIRSVSNLVFERPRTSSTLTVTVNLHHPMVASLQAALLASRQLAAGSLDLTTRTLSTRTLTTATNSVQWEILPGSGPAPASCFAATRGGFNIATGQQRGSFTVTATEAANCSTGRYTMRVWMDGMDPTLGAPYTADVPLAPGSVVLFGR
jgi:hypothetical protein